jgi:2-oxoglutarate ferredoxin oxidoreductase subunit beta
MDSNVRTVQGKRTDFKSDIHNDWCPGCGDFGILAATQQALAELGLLPWEVTVFSGIGCSGKSPHYINAYGVHTLHGRVLAYAQGAKIANPSLHVVAVGGDGDGYGIGAGHFVHAGRRNVDLAYIVFNNEVYGLTKGQASPTLKRGQKPKSLPSPNLSEGINPLAMAIACGYTFVGRSYAFDAKHLREMIKKAILHPGIALLDVLQPCPTYNDLHTQKWFAEKVEIDQIQRPRTVKLEELGYDGLVHDGENDEEIMSKKSAALRMVETSGPRIPLGVFYQVALPTYSERLGELGPTVKDCIPAQLPIEDADHRPATDLTVLYSELTV